MSITSARWPPALNKIVQRLQQTTEPKRRYEYLLWFAKRLAPFPEFARIPANKVPGCASQVYILVTLVDGQLVIEGDSDAQITKGLVGLLAEGLNGLSPAEMLQINPDFIQNTRLDISLTPSRVNGFYNIFQTIREQALTANYSDHLLDNTSTT
jgi:cysteine desulfuration protein SufE